MAIAKNNAPQLEQVLLEVWTQAMADGAKVLRIADRTYPVRKTSSGLLQIDFTFQGRELRGLEQNRKTNSRWAALARSGQRIMQFLEAGCDIANVTEGKPILYGHGQKKDRPRSCSAP